MGRSRSSSSSSSSSGSSGSDKHHKKDKHKAGKDHKDKKDKKDKDKKHKDKKDKHDAHGAGHSGASGLLGMIAPLIGGHQQHDRGVEQHGGGGGHQAPFTAVPVQHAAHVSQPPLMPVFQQHQQPSAPYGQHPQQQHYAPQFQAPPWGVHLNTANGLPPPNVLGWPVSNDYGGEPLFLALVPHEGGIHPGKVVQGHNPPVYVSWGGREVSHNGDFAVVPFNPEQMYWAPSRGGELPYGARPVDGGREADGAPLFHAIATVHGIRVPGKAGRHLGGASVPFGGQEHLLQDCDILCWR